MLTSKVKEGESYFDFNRFVNNCEMMDVKAKWLFYTWRIGHKVEDFIQERLDRVLLNPSVLKLYLNLEDFVSSNTRSDHNMLWLNLDANANFGYRLFKYKMA